MTIDEILNKPNMVDVKRIYFDEKQDDDINPTLYALTMASDIIPNGIKYSASSVGEGDLRISFSSNGKELIFRIASDISGKSAIVWLDENDCGQESEMTLENVVKWLKWMNDAV